jgi:hypothetical protein
MAGLTFNDFWQARQRTSKGGTATRLAGLTIDELSAVASPASGLSGWLANADGRVFKSADAQELVDIIKAQAESSAALREALGVAIEEITKLKNRTIGRTGLGGQEVETTKSEPSLGQAFFLAARGAKVELR